MHTGTKQQLTHQNFTIFFTITNPTSPLPTTIVSTQNYKDKPIKRLISLQIFPSFIKA
jgi:hypothetical protein